MGDGEREGEGESGIICQCFRRSLRALLIDRRFYLHIAHERE